MGESVTTPPPPSPSPLSPLPNSETKTTAPTPLTPPTLPPSTITNSQPKPTSPPPCPAHPLHPSPTLPKLTVSTTSLSLHRTAQIVARASASDPFARFVVQERFGIPGSQVTLQHHYEHSLARLQRKIGQGGFVVEAGGWAAVACWESGEVWGGDGNVEGREEDEDGEGEGRGKKDGMRGRGRMFRDPEIPDAATRPIFMDFLRKAAQGKREIFPRGQRYWHLSLMARDPGRTEKGVVRALLEPFVARAKAQGLPVWCEAGNDRARDVYAWVGGFRVVGAVDSGAGVIDDNGEWEEGGVGIRTWLMVANWPVERHGKGLD